MSIEPNDRIIDLVDSLPTVLAIPLAEYERENNPVLTLWAASDLMEITLKFLVMAALGEHEELPAELQEELRDKQLERPTLGNWMGMAEIIGNYLPSDTRLSEIPSTAARIRELLGTNESSESEGLLSMRNKFLAHGGPCKQKQAQELVEIWKPKVDEVVENSLDWLSNHKLLAIDASGESFLLQGEEAVEWEDKDNLATGSGVGSAWLLLEGTFLPLGPLTTFDTEERALNLYIRREEVGLQYLRMDDEGGFQESGREEVEWFRKRFHSRLKNQSTSEFIIHSFESDIRKEAARRVGRAEELEKLLHSLRSMDRGYLWIGGPAGIGKSNLMCCAMEALLDDPPENILVLPYLFRAGDDRCGKESFLRFVRERLEKSELLVPAETSSEEKEEGSQNKKIPDNPIKELRDLFSRLQEGKKVLLLLDGLDEIAERSPRFVEDIIFGIFSDLDKFLLAGAARPDFGIPESFLSCGALDPFPKGLPSMGENDARAFLLERAGNIRKRMLGMDKEKGEEVTNRFFAKVAERSDGLPIYLNCLLHDLHQGKISPENPDSLPRGIHAYHEELLQRHSLGDFQAVATPSLVILAMAHEPLTTVELTVFLKRMNRIGTENLELINRVLGLLSSMLKRAPDPGGEEGYTLYHHSLREHILNSSNLAETVISIRNSFSNSRLRPSGDALDVYLYRRGVSHLLENNRREDAIEWMTDFELTMGRFQALDFSGRAADSWYADWEKLAKFIKFSRDCKIWWEFAESTKDHFRKPGWESWRVFFQAAMDHADDSPVTIGAEKFYTEGKCDWTWLRWTNRNPKWKPSPLIGSYQKHWNWVGGVNILPNDRILSWDLDGNICIWDLKTRTTISVFKLGANDSRGAFNPKELTCDETIWFGSERQDHDIILRDPKLIFKEDIDKIIGCSLINKEQVLSWSEDSEFQIWNLDSSERTQVFRGHSDGILGVKLISDRFLLSWSMDTTLRKWDVITGKEVFVVNNQNGIDTDGVQLLKGGNLLSKGLYNTLRIINSETGEIISKIGTDEPNSSSYWAPQILDDQSILCVYGSFGGSFGGGDSVCRWDWKNGGGVTKFEGHSGIKSTDILEDGRILSSYVDGTLRIWKVLTGQTIHTLKGHADFTLNGHGSDILSNGNILSWSSSDDTVRVWNRLNGEVISVIDCHLWGAMALENEKFLTWSGSWLDTSVRIWDSTIPYLSQTDLPESGLDAEIFSEDSVIVRTKYSFLSIDVKTAEIKGTFSGHKEFSFGPKFFRNGRVLTWSRDKTLRIWDKLTCKTLRVLRGHRERPDAEILSDGRILSRSGKEIRIWDTEKRKFWNGKKGKTIAFLRGHSDYVSGAKELADGRILTWSADNSLRIWDVNSASFLNFRRAKTVLILQGHTNRVSGAKVLSADRILSWSDDKTLRIWDLNTGQAITIFTGHTNGISGANISDDGKILSWSRENIRIWDEKTGREISVFTGHTEQIEGALFSSKDRVVSWSKDQLLYVWNKYTASTEKIVSGPSDWEIAKLPSSDFSDYFIFHHMLERPLSLSAIRVKEKLVTSVSNRRIKLQKIIEPEKKKMQVVKHKKTSIYIHKEGKNFGPVDRKTIEECLASGRLVSSDWAWTRGMKEWDRLEKVLENFK